ncbi:FAD-binding protein [Duganella sp. BJB488]|uniref:NAD(P)/FAD-dependent oxidoreductase n=1 Tax=unclassified Duganella TaxID=2636909 RepID=UPI000E34EFAD|nr:MULTISPECIES: tryptophan 7-halogenase [unclassified Duganella]RFP09242.1 FAD-binding protein [Duganella sp. BJB475]RFP13130.1 FAD-binding protein [Duganella sp. BJB489]RFP17106.1 FAD-binding protein [Duganella sp. BJB488]RFP25277.1 FAD-binding protein [Duganella sp. BJB476]RFP31675.1 FAD-binding protein [Duganella sp. BJB480]
MRDGDILFDALVIGAGLAGVSTALRLQQLGYRVLLVQRSAVWPRAQVGEALTPGVRNIIELLDVNDALAAVPHVAHAGSRVLWRSRTPDLLQQASSAIVDRGHFDAALLALAQHRGVKLEQPARLLDLAGAAGDWRVSLLCGQARSRQVRARFIFDASGRIDCAPRLAALWSEVDQSALAELDGTTQAEALEHGSLPGGRYRLMLVCDPHVARQATPAGPEARLRAACAASKLLRAAAELPMLGAVKMCSATPYLAPDSWQDGRLKLGDTAFALDPVSSSGVEKAMRFSQQAAVALHTVLGDDRPGRRWPAASSRAGWWRPARATHTGPKRITARPGAPTSPSGKPASAARPAAAARCGRNCWPPFPRSAPGWPATSRRNSSRWRG